MQSSIDLVQKVVKVIHRVVGEVVVVEFQVGVRSWNGVNRSATNVTSGVPRSRSRHTKFSDKRPLAHEVCSAFLRSASWHLLLPTH